MASPRLALAATLLLAFALIIQLASAQNNPRDYVNAHNRVRRSVNARPPIPPVSWDRNVAGAAQSYINIIRRENCRVIPYRGPYGWNIAFGRGNFNAVNAVNQWANERRWYDYRTNRCAPGRVCTHYTQVVWRRSTRIGCARSTCPGRRIVVVCMYNPRGNIPGQRPYMEEDVAEERLQMEEDADSEPMDVEEDLEI